MFDMSDRPVVMVVEDDKEMNELECELLQIHGMDSVPAYDGLDAVNQASTCHADAVLLDIMLPEMDGFECCRQLRQLDGPNVPIILITALDNDSTREEGFRAGASAFFTKPFDPNEIVETLRNLLEQAGSHA
jgi:DNA-binding response OmpR family regulator